MARFLADVVAIDVLTVFPVEELLHHQHPVHTVLVGFIQTAEGGTDDPHHGVDGFIVGQCLSNIGLLVKALLVRKVIGI